MKSREQPMTVTEVADAMGLSPAKVLYHIKKLVSIGILYMKYTKVVNGIVAKYYDFTTDSIALSVTDEQYSNDILKSKLITEYGGYFDEAKQKFFNLYNVDKAVNDGNVYIIVKDSFPIDANRVSEMNEELKALLKKYRSDSDTAVPYSLFFFMIQNNKEQGKK